MKSNWIKYDSDSAETHPIEEKEYLIAYEECGGSSFVKLAVWDDGWSCFCSDPDKDGYHPLTPPSYYRDPKGSCDVDICVVIEKEYLIRENKNKDKNNAKALRDLKTRVLMWANKHRFEQEMHRELVQVLNG